MIIVNDNPSPDIFFQIKDIFGMFDFQAWDVFGKFGFQMYRTVGLISLKCRRFSVLWILSVGNLGRSVSNMKKQIYVFN